MIARFTEEYRFLSNFWPCRIEFEGETYASAEHAYQAAKTLDKDARRPFWAKPTIRAGEAKKLGSPKKLKLRPDWDSVKYGIMYSLVEQKFKDPELAKMLISTIGHDLVEGNEHNDVVWGVCRGKGTNWLGRILMDVREKLVENSKS